MFIFGSQEDSHELMKILFDKLHEVLSVKINLDNPSNIFDVKNSANKYILSSMISDTFDGILERSKLCCNCNKIFKTYENFFDLTLAIPEKSEISDINLD